MSEDPPKPKHDHETLDFPENFIWGTATSAHQVEGNNTNNDWWAFEQTLPESKQSLEAANQYELFEQDFKLAKDLSHNAHRLSIEWSRIEPKEGQFSQEAIDHYKTVLKSLKDKEFTVMLTLHHFTNPLWFEKRGGWEDGKSSKLFERFVKRIVPEFAPFVDLWVTINEPTILAFMGYLTGMWPPFKKGKWATMQAYHNLAAAHVRAYQTIHQIIPTAQVGIAQNVSTFSAFHHHSLREIFAEWISDKVTNHLFYELTGRHTHDFLGLNYYFNRYISFNGEKAQLPSLVDIKETKKEVSDLGWEIYPQGMFEMIMDFSDYHLPIYITENGIATTNDDRRVRFLISYLSEIYHAIQAGARVKGYFHWSLIDNFEWLDAYQGRFGLVEVDFKTQKRTPRPSAYVYQEIIENNGIPHKLLKLLGHSNHVHEVVDCPSELCSM